MFLQVAADYGICSHDSLQHSNFREIGHVHTAQCLNVIVREENNNRKNLRVIKKDFNVHITGGACFMLKSP